MPEDCYFFQEDIHIRTLCTKCCEENEKYDPDKCWFWRGSAEGYGPYIFKCHECKKVIYDQKEA